MNGSYAEMNERMAVPFFRRLKAYGLRPKYLLGKILDAVAQTQTLAELDESLRAGRQVKNEK